MNEISPAPRRSRSRAGRFARCLLPAAIVVVLAGAVVALSGGMANPLATRTAARQMSASVLEEQHGVRIEHVGIIAAGGLLDIRFNIVDAEKAAHIWHDPKIAPVLVVERNGETIKAPGSMSHGVNLKSGGTYFMLYPNRGSAARPGDRLLVSFGGVQFGSVVAQ